MKPSIVLPRPCPRRGIHLLVGCSALISVASLNMPASRAQAPLGSAKTDSTITLQQTGGFILFDLTSQNDKTQPVVRLGYQSSDRSDQIKRAYSRNPVATVHNLWNYAIEVRGTPSGNSSSLFGGGAAATGAQVNVSFGQENLFSYVRALVSKEYNTQIGVSTQRGAAVDVAKTRLISAKVNFTNITTTSADVSAAKDALAVAKLTTNEAKIAEATDTFEIVSAKLTIVTARAEFLADRDDLITKIKDLKAKNRARNDLLQSALDYTNALIVFANDVTGTVDLPKAPESDQVHSSPLYDAWYARLGYSRTSSTFFNASNAYADQFQTKDSDGYSAQLGYNANFGGRLPVIFGVSGGVARTNNADQLSSIDVTQTQTFASPDGSTQRSTTRKRTALNGEYKQYTAGTAKFDVVLYPGPASAGGDGKKPRAGVALDLFGRAQGGTPFVYGLGVYLTQPGAPQKIYGGLNIYKGQDKKLAVDIVTGYNF